MFYYMYQITNLVNGKIYVGVHKTKSLDDGYMGSGKIIRSAIVKHGISNFSKVILEYFEDSKSMYAKEKEVVNEEFLLREDVYNLRRGGHGGFDHINKNDLHYKGYSSAADRNKEISPFGKLGFEWISDLAQINRTPGSHIRAVNTRLDNGNSFNTFGGMVHSNESKLKISNTMKMKTKGSDNSQFGTMWITDGVKPIKIKKSDKIPDGYRKGRK